jgi:hypothetical protein
MIALKMRKSLCHNNGLAALFLQVLIVSCLGAAEAEYGLPVKLDLSIGEVRKVLGAPTEAWNKGDMVTLESYYSRGIVAEFEHDKLFSITLNKDTAYRGFIPYAGTIVNGVKITDSKTTVLKKLGTPSKIESEALPPDTDPTKPELFPLQSKYYWQFKDYEVQATFLNQAQAVSEGLVWRNAGDGTSWPKDTLTDMTIRTLNEGSAHHH